MDTDYVIETMTSEEVYRALNSMGVRTSPSKVRDAIEQGKYPFGICIKMGKSREFEIYKTLFEQWVSERARRKTS